MKVAFTFKSGVQVVHNLRSFSYSKDSLGNKSITWESYEDQRLFTIDMDEVVAIQEVRR